MKNSKDSEMDDFTDAVNQLTDSLGMGVTKVTGVMGVSRDHDLFRKVYDISYDLVPRHKESFSLPHTNIRDNTYGFCMHFYRDCGDSDIADLPLAKNIKTYGDGRHKYVPGFEATDYPTPQAAMDAGIAYANSQIEKYGYGWTSDVQKTGFLDVYDSSGKLLFNLALTMEPKLREVKDNTLDALRLSDNQMYL